MIRVTILNPKETLFAGEAERVVLPGDCGDFEVLPFHKTAISLLRHGAIILDGKTRIRVGRGVAAVHGNDVTALVEQ